MTVILESRIPEIVATSPAKTKAVVGKTAFDIHGRAIMRSRVDTGQMRDGWSVEIQGDFDALVYNPVEHTVLNEDGTTTMAAQPMLAPSVEDARDPFFMAMSQVYS